LVKKASARGVYENFGQKEVTELEDKYSDHQYQRDGVFDAIGAFNDWCMDYTGR